MNSNDELITAYKDGCEAGKKEVGTFPNKAAFEKVCADLEAGNELTFTHVGDVFGPAFWVELVYALMDAQSAARAIEGAIRRLSRAEESKDETSHV